MSHCGEDPFLAEEVGRLVCEARNNPGVVTMARLESLDKLASREFNSRYAALYSPIAPYTWQMRVQMEPNIDEAPVQEITFPAPVEVVGLYSEVTGNPIAGAPPFIFPTKDLFDVSITVDDHEKFTSNVPPIQAPAGPQPTDFVSLNWVTVTANRLWGVRLLSAKPKMLVKFRWSVANRAILQVTRAQVSIGFAVKFINRPPAVWRLDNGT